MTSLRVQAGQLWVESDDTDDGCLHMVFSARASESFIQAWKAFGAGVDCGGWSAHPCLNRVGRWMSRYSLLQE